MRKLGDTITFDFTTHNPSTGMVQNADVLPTCEVFEDAVDDAILTPVVTNRVGKTGDYRVSIEATVGNGFEVGKTYNVVVLATVNSISAKSRIGVFVLDSKRNADMNDLSQAQILSDAVPFQGARVDASISSRSTLTDAQVWLYSTRELTSFGTLIADIWTYSTRVLTSFGSLVNDISIAVWGVVTRTLTAGTKDAEIDAIKTETDKIQPEIINKKNEFKADISLVALETTVQSIENRTSNLPDDPTSETNALSSKTDVIAEVNANEVKIDAIKTEEDLIKGLLENGFYGLDALKTLIETMATSAELQARFDEIKGSGWTTETLKVIKGAIDSLDLELDGVAKESTLATKASQASVDAVKIDTASIVSTLSTLVADIWAYTTRTITSFGTLIVDVWSNLTRTLTAGTKDAEIDAIKTKTDLINWIDVTAIKTKTDTINWSDITAIKTKTDTILWSDVMAIKTETDKIQSEIIGKKDEYKADVSNLALETTAQLIKNGVSNGMVEMKAHIETILREVEHINPTIVEELDLIMAKTDQLTFTVAGRVGLTPEEHDNVMMIEGASDNILEIYELYGLDPTKPLIVTPTFRQAGTILQRITTKTKETRVQRQ
jgi:hypothetical protein